MTERNKRGSVVPVRRLGLTPPFVSPLGGRHGGPGQVTTTGTLFHVTSAVKEGTLGDGLSTITTREAGLVGPIPVAAPVVPRRGPGRDLPSTHTFIRTHPPHRSS